MFNHIRKWIHNDENPSMNIPLMNIMVQLRTELIVQTSVKY